MNRRSLVLPSVLLVSSLSSCSAKSPASPGMDGSTTSGDAGSVDASPSDAISPPSDALAAADVVIGPDDIDPPVTLAAGVAPTPPMGWNSWNAFQCSVSESLVKAIADAMGTSGMKAAGYQYVNIDDCWAQTGRAADGSIQPGTNFPDGIQAVADYVHMKGLKLGIYSDRGTATCAGRAGSQGYETQDANTYASWGVDYVKYDNCSATLDIQTQYQTMLSALDATTRPFVFSLSAWNFYEWEVDVGNLWRTTTDITDSWDSVFANIENNRTLAAYASPNHWNDPDMLEVGNGGMTADEDQSHFSLWAISNAPLIAGNDPRSMSAATKAILLNQEVIAVNQDPLGLQGFPVLTSGNQSVWAKPLNESGARAVVLLNADATATDISFDLPLIGLRAGSAKVRDLVAQADLGTMQGQYTVNVRPHAVATLKVSGVEPPRPYGTAFLSDLTWAYAANGLGAVHKDESNSTSVIGKTSPIMLGGTMFPKGLGVDAPSLVIYRMAQKCSSFTATVGVDDFTKGQGSVVFQVWGDDQKLFDSGSMTGKDPPQQVQVSLDGTATGSAPVRRLKLRVTNDQDGSGLDRADWGDAKVVCQP
jgi:alpha-galactosidase